MTAVYDVEIVPNVLIPCDGYELAADLYRPRDAPPAPALVTLLPYNKDWVGRLEFTGPAQYFAAHGYPSLLADFRGTGSSSGEMRPPFDAGEADDGVALVEWAATQPWCDGQVGMWGISYGGITSLRTASRRPAPLKAIVPIMGQVDPDRDFLNPYGARGMVSPLAWGLQNLVLQLTPPLCRDEGGRWERVWQQRLEHAAPFLEDIVRLAPRGQGWLDRAIAVEDVEVPSLCVTGWRDLVCDAMVDIYERLNSPKQLIAGPWMHTMPQDAQVGAVDFLPTMLRWWDRWLRGITPPQEEREPAATVFVLGRDRWTTFEAWPGSEQASRELALSSDGVLGGQAAGTATTLDDATVGLHGGLAWYPSSGIGLPDDQHEDDRRSLAFTTEPLSEPLEIIGRPTLRLALAEVPDAPGPIVAKLSDVTADGRAHPITTGTAVAHDGVVEIALAPIGYELAAGHRLRLTVTTDDFPRLWPDPNARPVAIVCDPPQPSSVLTVPLAPVEGRSALDWAAPDPVMPEMILEPPTTRYEIARDLAQGRARVTIADEGLLLRPPHLDGTVTFSCSIVADVATSARDQARVTGAASAIIVTGDERMEVEVDLVMEADRGVATGTVTTGGEVEVSRRWELQRPTTSHPARRELPTPAG